ncbi:hypothetical protein KIH31_14995 [Paenarthrobacter sp. DKR-5]|uniref:DUF6153 family protein n=1 Tax=Paenarthrobacter sp. DKR-5 TaxID=2835535 RepID=UPI001BDC4285|nr:DUF6153 family protein [Paenarthrobacter sp. DKR-5]MBT1003901.1 hypothetical protein [Paenarthrobacter sp. DKR-5]
MPHADRSFLRLVRAAATVLGLLGVIVGLLGMHVLAGSHTSEGSGHAGAGLQRQAPMAEQMAEQPATAVRSYPAVQPAVTGHDHHPVFTKDCSDGTNRMSMADPCTLDRPQASVDGVVDLPSLPVASPGPASRQRPVFGGSWSGADPPSLTLLGISRT